jgi:hypothetical protein
MLLSELSFGTYLCYTPRGETELAHESTKWRDRLKTERAFGPTREPTSSYIAGRLAAELPATELADMFTPEVTLVPVPSSAILKPGWLWIPLRIAEALRSRGLGGDVLPCLSRRIALRKSAWSDPKERPNAEEHYRSLAVDLPLKAPTDIVLIDDVVTRGATLLGAASRLAETFPEARVRAFAVMRAISNPMEFKAIREPCLGTIRRVSGGATLRRP